MEHLQIKNLEFDTNFNGKMGCKILFHIGFLPAKSTTVESLENITFKITAKDGSHEPIMAKLTGILVVDIQNKKIPEAFTYASHEMDEKQFVDYMFKQFPNRMQNTQQLGIYQYKKIA